MCTPTVRYAGDPLGKTDSEAAGAGVNAVNVEAPSVSLCKIPCDIKCKKCIRYASQKAARIHFSIFRVRICLFYKGSARFLLSPRNTLCHALSRCNVLLTLYHTAPRCDAVRHAVPGRPGRSRSDRISAYTRYTVVSTRSQFTISDVQTQILRSSHL